MSEPTTVITEYALGLGAFLGGTWHGFWQDDLLWNATTLSVGGASCGGEAFGRRPST